MMISFDAEAEAVDIRSIQSSARFVFSPRHSISHWPEVLPMALDLQHYYSCVFFMFLLLLLLIVDTSFWVDIRAEIKWCCSLSITSNLARNTV
jgi:hypothetical protein